MGKGDSRRPTQVPDKGFQERWDKCFPPVRPKPKREKKDE